MKSIDIILLIIIAAVITAALVSIIKNRKSGNNCSCGCSGCSQSCKKSK